MQALILGDSIKSWMVMVLQDIAAFIEVQDSLSAGAFVFRKFIYLVSHLVTTLRMSRG